MPKIVGILIKQEKLVIFQSFAFYEQLRFYAQLEQIVDLPTPTDKTLDIIHLY